MTVENIEQAFAAAVANARGNARLANTAGYDQSTVDQLDCALADLWHAGSDAGLSRGTIQAIVARYVDENDMPRPLGNVVPFRR